MHLLQGALMECEGGNFSPEEIEQASKVAKRLLGFSKLPSGAYMSVHAEENLWTGDIVVVESPGNAKKWKGVGQPSGIAIGPLSKGCFGWILRS